MYEIPGVAFFHYDKITIGTMSRKYEYGIDINTTNTRYHTIDLSITSTILAAMLNRWVTSKYHHRIKDFVVWFFWDNVGSHHKKGKVLSFKRNVKFT